MLDFALRQTGGFASNAWSPSDDTVSTKVDLRQNITGGATGATLYRLVPSDLTESAVPFDVFTIYGENSSSTPPAREKSSKNVKESGRRALGQRVPLSLVSGRPYVKLSTVRSLVGSGTHRSAIGNLLTASMCAPLTINAALTNKTTSAFWLKAFDELHNPSLKPLFSKIVFSDASIDRAVATPLDEEAIVSMASDNESDLSKRLRLSLDEVLPSLECEERIVAKAAVAEALALFAFHDVSSPAWASVNDEGVVVLQWREGNFKVLFIFSGDGQYTVSAKRNPGDTFYHQAAEHNISDGLTGDVLKHLESFSAN